MKLRSAEHDAVHRVRLRGRVDCGSHGAPLPDLAATPDQSRPADRARGTAPAPFLVASHVASEAGGCRNRARARVASRDAGVEAVAMAHAVIDLVGVRRIEDPLVPSTMNLYWMRARRERVRPRPRAIDRRGVNATAPAATVPAQPHELTGQPDGAGEAVAIEPERLVTASSPACRRGIASRRRRPPRRPPHRRVALAIAGRTTRHQRQRERGNGDGKATRIRAQCSSHVPRRRSTFSTRNRHVAKAQRPPAFGDQARSERREWQRAAGGIDVSFRNRIEPGTVQLRGTLAVAGSATAGAQAWIVERAGP